MSGRLPIYALLLALMSSTVRAFPQKPTLSKARPDAAWAQAYAGTTNDIKWDPHFIPMLRRALPQHQSFWLDHHKFTPLPELAQLYIGVPGTVLVDDDRYVTADGCMPHLCSTRGMVWIDTRAKPTKLVFGATYDVDSEAKLASHLFLFTSFHLDTNTLPEPLVLSVRRWIDSRPLTSREDLDRLDDRHNIVLVTIVQPSGEMIDFSPDLLRLSTKDSGAKP